MNEKKKHYRERDKNSFGSAFKVTGALLVKLFLSSKNTSYVLLPGNTSSACFSFTIPKFVEKTLNITSIGWLKLVWIIAFFGSQIISPNVALVYKQLIEHT